MGTFREYLGEKVDYYDAIYSAMEKSKDDKFDQALWDNLEIMTADKDVYQADATPDELLDMLSDKQLKELYNILNRKFKKLFESNISEATRGDFEKSPVYRQFNTAMSEVYKFGDMWKTKELEKSLDRKEFNELRKLQFDATQNLAELADKLREISVRDMNEAVDLDEINEADDMDIIKKVSKKALGGNVNKVVDQKDGYFTINVAGSVIPWDDFKSLEINLSSFEIDNIDFDDNDILIRKK